MPQRRSSNRYLHILGGYRQPPTSTERGDRWQEDAACATSEPSLFELPDPSLPSPLSPARRRAAAFAICATCPVAAQCLAQAIEMQDTGVIRAGRIFPTTWRGVPLPDGQRSPADIARLEKLRVSDKARRARNAANKSG